MNPNDREVIQKLTNLPIKVISVKAVGKSDTYRADSFMFEITATVDSDYLRRGDLCSLDETLIAVRISKIKDGVIEMQTAPGYKDISDILKEEKSITFKYSVFSEE